MIVGILEIELLIQESASLKDKRFVLKSIKDRLKNKFNVAVAEVDYQDKWQRAKLGLATVGSESGHVEEVMQKIFRYLDQADNYEIINYQFDYV